MTWRQGRRVPRNLYDGDRDIGRMDTPELARRVVDAVNKVDELDASWLVKDFSVLYGAARDAYVAIGARSRGEITEAEYHAAIDDLGRQIGRLKDAFGHTEDVKRYLRERDLGA